MEKLLHDVRATPKGQKKDLGKATAAKTYHPRIVEAAWCVPVVEQSCWAGVRPLGFRGRAGLAWVAALASGCTPHKGRPIACW